ncbi:peptidoglycan-binding protein [Streptomyces sp. NPDC003038]|uniref:peptidoglycan-binding domain-containing protein n=1 Tax=unclassified Streptomyces TaxID=2593676 RepID=UPI0033BD1B8E
MSHHPDESGIVPDDRLLIRPYFASSPVPSPSSPSSPAPTAPAWPQTGPASFPGPAPAGAAGTAAPDAGSVLPPAAAPARGPAPGLVPASAPAAPTAPVPVRHRRDRPGPLLPAPLILTLAVLALAGTAGLVFVMSGPDPAPRRASPPLGLSVPVLPARSPDGEASAPQPDASARSTGPTATPSASPEAPSRASASPKPASSPAAATPPSTASGTLRPGDRGPEVSALQERLYGQGFTYVSVTGVYDGQTRRGVAQLQRDRGITGDPQGVYGPYTRAAFG